MVNKKGYFYAIELLLVVFISVIFVLSMPESERRHSIYEEQENIKAIGYGTLFSLDKQGILDLYIDNNITQSNFTLLKEHIETSIDSAEIAKIEYIYSTLETNYSKVFFLNSSGDATVGGEVPKRKREILVSVIYTYSRTSDPITIKLYLRRYEI
ncbi:MAG: hypothetical protein JSW73_04665 [Candidatus Woesearchaeota archaeon]|nr:MAG: hypothetical protein JSW73_04665 [Candidatus Woesearchaeota archaeon]